MDQNKIYEQRLKRKQKRQKQIFLRMAGVLGVILTLLIILVIMFVTSDNKEMHGKIHTIKENSTNKEESTIKNNKKVVTIQTDNANKETEKIVNTKRTLKNLIYTASLPVGKTLYIWGGGWNDEDTGAGDDAKRIGVNPEWENFFKSQDYSYNYKNFINKRKGGLDCSGYIGWCFYNIMNTADGKRGYVYKSFNIAKKYEKLGFGTFISQKNIKDYKTGDIMSTLPGGNGHVYMVLGKCEDGSLVIVHSSPNGVKLSGTPTPDYNSDSQALALATKYMKNYRAEWYAKFPDCSVSIHYLQDYNQLRLDVSGNKKLSDPDNIANMKVEDVLEMCFSKE